MRGVLLALVALTLAGLLAARGAESAVRQTTTIARAGITATLPVGWRVVDERLTPCTDPVERLTVVGRGALVMLQERASGAAGFAARPGHFALRGGPTSIGCCEPLRRPGWFSQFQDASRGFYLYVYLGGPGTRAEALRILDSLRVEPRRR